MSAHSLNDRITEVIWRIRTLGPAVVNLTDPLHERLAIAHALASEAATAVASLRDYLRAESDRATREASSDHEKPVH